MTVDNKTLTTELWALFCNSEYLNTTCDEYFTLNNLTEIRAIPGLLSGVIKGEKDGWNKPEVSFCSSINTKSSGGSSVANLSNSINPVYQFSLQGTIYQRGWIRSCFSLSPSDNLWGDYGPADALIEKKSQLSAPAQDTTNDIYKPYVFNDISTYFTLLVGIYFPSVTGKCCTTPEYLCQRLRDKHV